MSRLQAALEQDAFTLLVQPVRGLRGDCYHEVLLRMRDDNGALIFPEQFLPIAQEFGLSSRVDLWVLERTLSFLGTAPPAVAGPALCDQPRTFYRLPGTVPA